MAGEVSAAQARTGQKDWRRALTFTVFAAVVVIVALVTHANWEEYAALLGNARLLPLAGALFAGLVGQFLNTVIAHESLKVDGEQIPLRSVYRIISVGGLAKFIPGGVWQIGSQYGLGRAEGLGFRRSMLAWIEPTAFNITVGGGLALLAATTVGYGIAAPVLIVSAALAFVASTNPVRHAIYRRVRLIPADYTPSSRFAGWPSRFTLTVAIIVTTGLAGMLVISAFRLSPSPNLAGAVAAFVGAWVVGVLAFPIPGGLGVREGALVLALAPWLPAHQAVLVAAASRLVAIAAELIAAVVGAVIQPGTHPDQSERAAPNA